MKEVLFFNTMLTPKLITVIYWLLLVLVLISGIGTMFSGFGFTSFIFGLLVIVFGALAVRIWCELLIVIFKINENTRRMAQNADAKGDNNR